MPLQLTAAQETAVKNLQRAIGMGHRPAVDHDLVMEPAELAAAATGAATIVRPYENGIIVNVRGLAFADGGDAEADTMAERMHEKYLAVLLSIGGRPKTNDAYEPLYTFLHCPAPQRDCAWVVAQGDLISGTFKHLATAGIANLTGRLSFGFLPFSQIGL
jgi:hypothetical protein